MSRGDVEMENKEYKSLGNAIREAVFNRKNAPTMLPDSTVDKLGLNEEDILYIEVDEEDVLESTEEPIDEAKFMVKVDGIGEFIIDGKSAAEIKTNMRKYLRNPKSITSIERMTGAAAKKYFMGKAVGRGDGDGGDNEEKQVDEARARRMGDRQPPKDQDSYYTKQRAEKMAKELARALNDLSVPDSDSVVYEYRGRKRGRDYKKENAQARKQLEQIISQIEGVSKLVGKVVNKWNQSKP